MPLQLANSRGILCQRAPEQGRQAHHLHRSPAHRLLFGSRPGMTTASNEQIFRAIGNLEATVESLRRDIQQSETRADTHRTAIHERVDDVAIELKQTRLETVEMAGSIGTVIDNMKIVKDDLATTMEI